MKHIWMLAILYCIVHGASGDFAVSYEGMDQATVAKLVQQTYSAKFEFIDKAAYDAFVAAHSPKLPGNRAVK